MKILKLLLDHPDTMLDVRHGIGEYKDRGAVSSFPVKDLMAEIHEYAESVAKPWEAEVFIPKALGEPGEQVPVIATIGDGSNVFARSLRDKVGTVHWKGHVCR